MQPVKSDPVDIVLAAVVEPRLVVGVEFVEVASQPYFVVLYENWKDNVSLYLVFHNYLLIH